VSRARARARFACSCACAILFALTTPAFADDEPHAADTGAGAGSGSGSLQEQLSAQLYAEALTVDRATTIVQGKLDAQDVARTHRARAAARVLLTPRPDDASLADHLAAARRAAAARLLLERDAQERGLLSTELGRLRDAATRIATDASHVAAVVEPGDLAWPAHGTIARKFGPFEHDHSHAQLSRRGIDIEVDDRAPVVSPADGTVRYAGPIRGLDHGLVIDAHGTYVVVGKLGDDTLPVGAEVHKGDHIGHAAHHRVYLEVRVALGAGGLPLDPEPLLPKSKKHPRS
jgi:septal ring factor EnvC (AmiA/AmiB activator)